MAAADVLQPAGERSFLLQRVQPVMTGLIDGSLSTLASVALGGAIIAAISTALRTAAG
jgi:hypothetical protein